MEQIERKGKKLSRIVQIEVFPTSFPVDPKNAVTLGVGRTVKRDAVVVKVTTEDGLIGWGEAHHGRAPGAIARLIESTIKQLVIGQDAFDTVGIWRRVYDKQLASHGMGAASCMALSGVDIALWDIRAKALKVPLYRLLGGGDRAIEAYAGGVSLGYQEPEALVAEARTQVELGYRALKLRIGDTVARDIERVAAVRSEFGDELTILVDANTAYSIRDAREAMPALDDMRVGWLEEPFPPHDWRSYEMAAHFGVTPLAAGENHFMRYEFQRVVEQGAITILQPDISKSGGITEVMRIAHLASTWKLPVHPHTSTTAINMAASVHLLCALDNGGYFEADVSKGNLFRDKLGTVPYSIDKEGCVRPLQQPGIGIEVDEAFLRAHPLIDGPSYV